MSEITSHESLLTPEKLLEDATSVDVGFWKITVKTQRHKIHYIIVKDSAGAYTLAACRSVSIIGTRKKLDEITQLFNDTAPTGRIYLR